MRSPNQVSFTKVGVVVLGFFVMGIGSLPLIARSQGPVPQKVLLEKAVELPSKDVNVKIRHVTFPVSFKTPQHTHEGPGPRYILKGKLEVIEGGVTGTYGPGEVFWESGIPMTAENVAGEETEVIVIELLPVK